MSQAQLQRIKVIEKLVEGHMGVAQSAELLGLSRCQVRRLRKRYSAAGVEWVYH